MDYQDSSTTLTIKAVYCPGSTGQEEIRRFSFPLPAADSSAADCSHLYEELRRRIAEACSGCVNAEGLNLYYMDADQERVRFSTSEELVQLLRLHHQQQAASSSSCSAGATLRILAEPSSVPAAAASTAASGDCEGVEHPGVRCDGCNQGIRGRRFRCFQCPNYDLCQRCILRGLHDQHSMLVLHRPGDSDSLPPWISRMVVAGPWMQWGAGAGGIGVGGRQGCFPWQQQQQQQSPQHHQMFKRPHYWAGRFGGHHLGMQHPSQVPTPPSAAGAADAQQQSPMMFACPKLARKMEKARRHFEAKMAKRCDRLQRKLARKQMQPQHQHHHKQHYQHHHQQQQQLQQQQQQQGPASASGTADEPIRIDLEDQQQQQQMSPEEAMLLKQLKKRQKQQSASKKKTKHHGKHHHHHKKGHGGRKRRRSRSSSTSSSSSSSSTASSSSSGSESSSGSSSDSDSESDMQKNYRQLLKKFRKMGFKDDETCWLRALIREKRGNLNEILDAIRQRGSSAGAGGAIV